MKQIKTGSLLFTILCLALLLSACLNLEDSAISMEAVDIKVTSVSIDAITFDSVHMTAGVSVRNPLPIDVSLLSFTNTIEAAGLTITSSGDLESTPLKSRSNTELQIPVTVSFDELDKESLESQELPYTLTLDIAFHSPLSGRPLNSTLSYSDTLPVPRLPRISVQEVIVSDFRLQTISFDIVLHIENPNLFPVHLEEAAFLFAVNEKPWLTSDLPEAVQIPAGGERSVAVPVQFNYMEAGMATVNLLVAEKKLDYTLQGSGKAGILWDQRLFGPFSFEYSSGDTATIIRPDSFGL